MSHITNSKSTSANSRRKRIIKVAPMTRAVRVALAASLAALALGASSGAFAANCNAPTVLMTPCKATSIDAAPVADLTLVHAAASPAGHGAFIMPLAISESGAGDVVIDNADPINEFSVNYDATAIYGYSSGGSVDITNQATGTLQAISVYGNATGIEGYAFGDVSIDNAGDTYVVSIYGNAIGLYGYSMTGDVSINNTAAVTAYSVYGLADGIFASGADVEVTNSGSISATGYTWAAGIEAQGTGTTTVTNDGDIYAASLDNTHAYGIYATGDVVNVGNSGNIEAQGYYATGIEAQGGSSVAVTNDGDIVAGSATTSVLATGINASSNAPDGEVTVTNNGSISGIGVYGGTGIAATATGTNGSASVINNGSIYASQVIRNGYGAYGIIASADGDASVDNTLTGMITVYSPGTASGASALSFSGNTSVTNAGGIDVYGYSAADGIVSFAQNGTAYAGNSGAIDVVSLNTGHGIDVDGFQGATAVNSGDIAVDGYRAFGIRANSGSGDVAVTNDGSIYATYGSSYGYTGRAYGIFAASVQGDVSVDNSGDIQTTVNGVSVGVFTSSTYGDIDVSNSGIVSAYSYNSTAVGVFARATDGMASVDNSGTIIAESYNGSAFGVQARGSYVEVINSGDITASGFAAATGIAALSYDGATVTTTGGAISVYAVGRANGIDAQSQGGDVTVDNASSIDSIGLVLGAKGIQGLAYGNVDIGSSGDIYTYSAMGNSIGIYGYSIAGNVSIINSGGITTISDAGLADGIFASGADVEVSNSGSIEVSGYTWAAGIEAQGTGTTSVGNDGDIYAVSMDATPAFGIYATGDVVTVVNTGLGNIEAQGYYATGIEAQGGSSVTVTNDGDIVAGSITTYYDPNTYTTSVYGSTLATGINATVNYAGGMVTVINNGSVSGVGYYGGTGIAATASGANGSASVTNSGSIYASQYTKYGYGAYGIVASADGNATISNTSTSSITVNSAGAASGASALSFTGNANVTNAGDITVESTSILNYTASGIVAFAQNGAAYAGNSGSVSAVAGYTAKAVDASGFTSATVVNSGSLYANAKYAYGVYASSGTGDVSVTNTAAGSIEAYSYAGRGFGVLGIATQGDVLVDNAGSIEVYGFGQSAGVFGVALEGDTNLTNSGDISVISGGDAAIGMFARADQGTASVNNSGDIVASDDAVNDGYVGYAAYGIVTRGAFGNVTNSGSIIADGNYYATGIAARSDDGTTVVTTASSQIAASASLVAIGIEGRSEYGNVSVTNGGHVTATSPDTAVGIFASAFGDVTINNSGVVMAVADGNDASVAAVQMESLDGQSTLNNAGTGSISVQGTEGYAFAVVGSDAVDTINNSGLITGAVTLYGGDDVFNNRSGGVWNVGTTYSTDFGDGDDTINNLAGGTIRFDSGAIYLGSSVDGNAFNNTGIIKVNGDSLIGMGTGTGGGVPTLVPSLNPLPLVNNGVIDMVDGVADDSLTIVGDLGGNGSLNIDVMVPNGPSDELHVDGSMVAGAVQTVNAYFHPSLLLAAQSGHFEKFAFVTGNSTAASFVGGQVIGYDPNNFLDLDVVVTSQINAANTADDVFSVGVDVVGLNDTGSLAASIASGAAGMLNAQVGTFKQRMGVNPYGDAGKVMSAFFRTYTSEGDVNPTHAMSNFGQGGHFDYDQSVWGREVGVNANLYGNFHAGVVLGSADGRQRLTGDGVGQNRMDGMTWGMYATWLVPNGFYVDLSGRWMAVDVRSTSVAGTLTTRAHTGAWNLEAGYEWMLGGLSVVPQLQYTRTTVDEVRPIYGTAATFESHDGTSSRGRVGVEVSKTFESGGIRWTPYGSINAIREFDGDMNYTVANVFQGGTSVQGTSTMAELGLGVQKGDWGFTIGANWIDGGAYKSTVGGQALVRFAW